MKRFIDFLIEEVHEGGIMHIEHPSDRTFDGPEASSHAVKTLKGIVSKKVPITRKIDDKMSFQAIRTPEGKVGVKYKGTGSTYNFSEEEVDAQHAHKPYLAHPIKTLLTHIGKVLPKRPGEYQGGFMSTPETRTEHEGHISHTPNTIEYSTAAGSEEGRKLKTSKVSAVIHTELKGEKRQAHPILNVDEFQHHPDVHVVPHVVEDHERNLHDEDKAQINHHISSAEKLMKGHSYEHLSGHETSLRTYINSTVKNETKPTVNGYKEHLAAAHDKKIEKVKTEKTKEAKRLEKEAALDHVEKNRKAFQKSFDIHHHIQQATNHLARGLQKSAPAGYKTKIDGKETGGEGYVGNGLKIVDREEFSKANLGRFKKQQEQQ